MEWIRKGIWVPFEGVAYPYPDFPAALQEAVGRDALAAIDNFAAEISPGTGQPVLSGDGMETYTSEAWLAARYKMETYTLDRQTARRILDSFVQFIDRFGGWGVQVLNIEGRVILGQGLHGELASLIARNGPLGAVRGLPEIDTRLASSTPDGINLWSYHKEIGYLAGIYRQIESGHLSAEQRHYLASNIQDKATDAVREMAVLPVVRYGGIAYEAEPLSLRAYLWRYLFDRFGRSATDMCRYCDRQFNVPRGRGRPPRYCEEHRAGKYHQAVLMERAPSFRPAREREPDDFNQ